MGALSQVNQNPFLHKTIEHWLTSVNELGYQMAFCQLLLSHGYSICHISRQNAFEQGKDIIAIGQDGTPSAFQLKGGNITNHRWRNEVKPEVEELVEYQIAHPSVDKSKQHISFLVTNGELEDTVRLGIDNLNSGKWRKTPLQVITKGKLLHDFLELSANFIPQNISDYKSFLELYFSDGKELIDERKFTDFIAAVLRLTESNLSKEERKRNISSSILFTSYIISPFKIENNHVSIIQVLSLLSAHIFALVEKYQLEEGYWLDSFEIIWDELMNTGALLQTEVADDGLQKLVNSVWDGKLGKFRRHLAVSYLLCIKVGQLLHGDSNGRDIATPEFLSKLKGTLTIWGESSFFPFILLFLYSRKTSSEHDSPELFKPIFTLVELLLKHSGRKGEQGILSPYYSITYAINRKFDLLEKPLDEDFSRRSFLLKPLIDLLARYNKRTELENYWREITYISQETFIPDDHWMHFLWHCNKGEQRAFFPKQTQSWKELCDEAMKIDLDSIPKTVQNQQRFLPFFLLLYPHRINTNLVKFLDEALSKIES